MLEKANYLSLNREPAEAQTQLLPKEGLLRRTEVSTWGVTQDRALSVGRGDIHDAIPKLGPQELRPLRPFAGALTSSPAGKPASSSAGYRGSVLAWLSSPRPELKSKEGQYRMRSVAGRADTAMTLWQSLGDS